MRGVAAIALLGGAVVAIASVAHAQAGPDAVEGHRLALKICSSCHVVSAEQPSPPILRNPAPDFRQVANKPGLTTAQLQKFLATTHPTVHEPGNMPNPELADEQIPPLTAYILSLRTKP